MKGTILKCGLVVITGLFCSLLALYWYGSRDLPEYNDFGLPDLAQANPPAGFNGFDHLDFLDEEFQFDLSEQARDNLTQNLEFDEWSLGDVVATLSANQAYIQSYVYAADQAYVDLPIPGDEIFAGPPYSRLFELSRLVKLKAQLLLASGNIDAAIDHALAPLKFSALLMRDFGKDAFLSYVVGSVMQSEALYHLREIAASEGAREAHLSRILEAVHDLPMFGEDEFERALGNMFVRDLGLVDYFNSLSLVERLRQFRDASRIRSANSETLVDSAKRLLMTLLPRYFFHGNREKNEVARVVSALAAQHDRHCVQIEVPPPSVHDKPLSWLGEFSPNSADAYKIDYGELYDDYFYRRCLLYTEREAIKVQLAFERHRFFWEEYPQALEALVPNFLSSMPRDFFDGEQLRYSRRDRILYSIGSNGVDGGGNTDFSELGYRECSMDVNCRDNPTFALPALE